MTATGFPLFSIVIPCYNYGKWISRSLDAIFAQSGNDYEVVVADDGSTDRTAAVVRSYQEEHGQILIYVHQQNRGPGAARNLGVRLAKGRYILFQDADDELLPEALECFRTAIDKHPNADFFWGGTLQVHYDGRTECAPIPQLVANREENFLRYIRLGPGLTYQGTILVNRAVLNRIRWPESCYSWADVVYHSHLFATCDGVAFSEAVITIHKHPISLGDNLELAIRDRLKTVDLLFDASVLPTGLMGYRQEFMAGVFVSLIKACERQARYGDALNLTHRAFRECPGYLMKGKHLRRYRRILFRLLLHKMRGLFRASENSEVL